MSEKVFHDDCSGCPKLNSLSFQFKGGVALVLLFLGALGWNLLTTIKTQNVVTKIDAVLTITIPDVQERIRSIEDRERLRLINGKNTHEKP
jgi:hypothetical protein